MIEDHKESQDEGFAKRPTNANDASTKESREGKIPLEKVSRKGKDQTEVLRWEKLPRALRTNVSSMA